MTTSLVLPFPHGLHREYYTAQFRVLGLDNPIFKFSNLPAWFEGHIDGTLAGTPKKAGSYPVRVFFTTSGCDQYRDIVVRVAHSVSSTEGYNRAAASWALRDSSLSTVRRGPSPIMLEIKSALDLKPRKELLLCLELRQPPQRPGRHQGRQSHRTLRANRLLLLLCLRQRCRGKHRRLLLHLQHPAHFLSWY